MATGGTENYYPMIPGSQELIEYGQALPLRDLEAHGAPDGRQALTRRVRQGVPRGLAAAGFCWRGHALVAPLCGDDPRLLHAGYRSQGAHSDDSHGLVDQPLTFTMDDLKRLPSVTRLQFIECAGNRHNGRQKTVQESHG